MSAKDTAKKIGRFMFLTGVYNQRNLGSILLVFLFAVLFVVLGGRIELRPLDKRAVSERRAATSQQQAPAIVREPARPSVQRVAPPVQNTERIDSAPSAAERLRKLREANRQQTGSR